MASKWLTFHSLQSLLKFTPAGARLIVLAMLGQVGVSLISPDVAVPAPTGVSPESLPIALAPNAPQLVQRGRDLYQAGRFSDAATAWQQAAQDYQAQADQLNQAMVLSNLSLAYQQLGQWPRATQAIAASLQLLETQPNRDVSADQLRVLAQALNTQGSLQLARGQAEQALATWQQATTSYAQVKDDTGVTRSQINQAQALQALGLYRRALKTLTQVNQTLQKQPDSITKAAGLRNLGNALRVVGDLDQSQQTLQRSLFIARQLKSPQEIGATLFSLGNTAQAQQNTPAALAFYQQAATVFPAQINRINVQLAQLDLLVETQQWPAAQTLWPQVQSQIGKLPASRTAIYAQIHFSQSLVRLKQANSSDISWSAIARLLATAVEQARNLGDRRAEAYALGSLGGLYEQTQQWSSAKNLTQQALLLAQAINAPDIAYRWQWQLGRLLKAEADTQGGNSPAQADAIAAYTEAVSTLQSLRNDLVAINPDIQFSFREEVEPVYRQLVDLLLQAERNAQPSQQQSLLSQARVVIESLQLAELNNFFRAACLDAQPVSVDQIVDQGNSSTAVIYPIVLPDRLEIILKLPQQPLRHYTTQVNQKDVETTLEDLRRQLIKPYTIREVQSLSQQTYRWLVQPTEADLARSGVKTLVFVLDGPLRNVPMSILYDGQQYLVQKYGVALTPSLQLLDPKPLERRRVRALTAGLAEPRHGFAQLNYVENELAQIKSEVSSVTLLNRAFTETTLQNQINSSPFPVVHLATHGQFSSDADQTFILAWDKPIKVDELDQLLRARNQSGVDAIELLVLSACETATGDKRAALGLAGVAVRAGARSTLASLWSLDDETSALLMSQFYQELAKSDVTKAEALRRAQLTLLQNPQYQHPRYWAPYVLVGNWL